MYKYICFSGILVTFIGVGTVSLLVFIFVVFFLVLGGSVGFFGELGENWFQLEVREEEEEERGERESIGEIFF